MRRCADRCGWRVTFEWFRRTRQVIPLLPASLVLFVVVGASFPVEAETPGTDARSWQGGLAKQVGDGSDSLSRERDLLNRAEMRGAIPVVVRLNSTGLQSRALADAVSAEHRRLDIEALQDRVLGRLSVRPEIADALGIKRFRLVPGFAMVATPRDLAMLRLDPEVADIVEDAVLQPLLQDSVPALGSSPDGSFGPGMYTGQGQVLAIIDTGVDSAHPFLTGQVIPDAEACFSSNLSVAGVNVASSLCPGGMAEVVAPGAGSHCDLQIDNCSHGTAIAGVMVGSGDSFSGVARDARLISVQAASRFHSEEFCGEGRAPCALFLLSDVLRALEYVRDRREDFPIAAVNLSFADPDFTPSAATCDDHALATVVSQLRGFGIATIVAAGDDGDTTGIRAPACISDAVSVGASIVSLDEPVVEPESNSADILDLLAPGSEINTPVAGHDSFAPKTGTSLAAGHVAGAWAVLREVEPGWSVSQVLASLQDTATPVIDVREGAEERELSAINLLSAVGDSNQRTLSVHRVGAGRVTSAPPGIDCGLDCTEAFERATDVSLTAVGDGDLEIQWGDACVGRGDCQVRMDENRTVRATFLRYLSAGSPLTGLSGARDSAQYFSIEVPKGATQLEIAISGGTGDADLFVRRGAPPTTLVFDCSPFEDGNDEVCNEELETLPAEGTWYVMIVGFEAYAGVTLEVDYTVACPYENDVVISDQVISDQQERGACSKLTVGPNVSVSSTGNLIIEAGSNVSFLAPFTVTSGGRMRIAINPDLRP